MDAADFAAATVASGLVLAYLKTWLQDWLHHNSKYVGNMLDCRVGARFDADSRLSVSPCDRLLLCSCGLLTSC
jgi:hypothetical protein